MTVAPGGAERLLTAAPARPNKAPWRWSAGIEAGIAMGAPLAAFTLAGYQSLGLIASLGAFTTLYGTALRRHDRLRALPLVAVGFVAASALGVVCASSAWLSIACLVGVAALAFLVGLGPPGPMQFVLVAAISGHLAAPARLGRSFHDAAAIPALVAVGALAAYALVAASLALTARHRHEPETNGLRPPLQFRWPDVETAMIAARVIAAVALAGVVSLALGVHRSYWTIMVAGAVLQARHDSRSSVIRALHRVWGTVLGVVVFASISLLEPTDFSLVAVLVVLQSSIEVVAARSYALALTFITPAALLIAAPGSGDPSALAGERIMDTVLGAAIAMTVLWISGLTGPRCCPAAQQGGNHLRDA